MNSRICLLRSNIYKRTLTLQSPLSKLHPFCLLPLCIFDISTQQIRTFLWRLPSNKPHSNPGCIVSQIGFSSSNVQLVTYDNLDLGCVLIEQAATEKAVQTIDGEIAEQLSIRIKH
ncbi:hypothetical protein ACS0TY_001806 [Phlomoides rotata]